MLLPEGILASPYEVLDYDATLTLGDTKGIKADFQRTETVRFLQSGVAGILDHVWGDGVALHTITTKLGTWRTPSTIKVGAIW